MSLGMLGAAIAWSSKDAAEDRSAHNSELATRALSEASVAVEQGKGAEAAAKEANRRLAALGKPTVPVPTVTATVPFQPPAVPEGLSAEQAAAVRAILSAEIAKVRPSLTPAERDQVARVAAAYVPKPADGKTPTAAQLQPLMNTALAGYCASGRCDAKPPVAGPTGPEGKKGPKGDPADPVTDAQVKAQVEPLMATAVAAYCGQESKPCAIPGPPGS